MVGPAVICASWKSLKRRKMFAGLSSEASPVSLFLPCCGVRRRRRARGTLSIWGDDPRARWVSHLSFDPTPVARHGESVCASERTSDERARYPGCLHFAAHATRGDRHCSSLTCLILSGLGSQQRSFSCSHLPAATQRLAARTRNALVQVPSVPSANRKLAKVSANSREVVFNREMELDGLANWPPLCATANPLTRPTTVPVCATLGRAALPMSGSPCALSLAGRLPMRASCQIGNPASFIKWCCNPALSLPEPCIGMERRTVTPGFE